MDKEQRAVKVDPGNDPPRGFNYHMIVSLMVVPVGRTFNMKYTHLWGKTKEDVILLAMDMASDVMDVAEQEGLFK